MPPKSKELQAPKKAMPAVARPPISNSSLMFVPEDAVEGHRERLDLCVDWSLSGSAIRHHQLKCLTEDIPPLSFTEALNNKIKDSFLNGFLDEKSTMTLREHWEVTLPLAIWDSENVGSEERKICFKNKNNITDNLLGLIKLTVSKNDREILKQGLRDAMVLRVTNSNMTYLDQGLQDFKHLTNLSLCGNYIDSIDCELLPQGLRGLGLQANRISSLDSFQNLPHHLLYLGLSRNILTEQNIQGISQFPRMLAVLDLSENDIYDLQPLLDLLVGLSNLTSLLLTGNPCSVCAAYSTMVITRLQRLKWLDNRQILDADRPPNADKMFWPHPDDLRSAYFTFTILRIMSAPMPPKPDKGSTGLFHVELELPLLDSKRRMFLMFSTNENLTEALPPPEDDFLSHTTGSKYSKESGNDMDVEQLREETDIFEKLEPKSSRIITHYTVFESNKVTWNKMMSFQEPTVRIFCPDLRALRDTFRSNITLRLVYTLVVIQAGKKGGAKSAMKLKPPPSDMAVTIATVKCSLQNPNWSQPSQHFHWDDSLGTNEAIHWGDGDLTAIQYAQQQIKSTKQQPISRPDMKTDKLQTPENLTMHFGFGIETLRRPLTYSTLDSISQKSRKSIVLNKKLSRLQR